MKKLLLLVLLLTPAASFAQLSVSGVGGENGFSAMYAQFRYQATPDFAVIPKYSYYQDDDMHKGLHRVGLRVEGWLMDRLLLGAEGRWTPEKNGYTDYSAMADGRFYILKNTREFFDNFYLGMGFTYTKYKQDPGFLDANDAPLTPFDLDEYVVKLMAGSKVWRINVDAVYAMRLEDESDKITGDEVIWADIPYFISVEKGIIKHSYGVKATLPTYYLDLTAGWSGYEFEAGKSSQSLLAAATVKIDNLAVTGAVEFRDFDKDYRKTYFSFSGSAKIF
ncbi:hypothetical protein Dip518_001129 [Parelusimicrobium proximum]|uniref:hypothetical protein n=1 Tax=Parelusimicrobium proximum TaxID=3228953 RepID=UPI003D16B0F3